MEDRYLPSSKNAVHVNTDGALIVEEDAQTSDGSSGEDTGTSSGSRDSRDIYLPKHTEWISHVAIDIGGSLAKVVYFSRAPTAAAAGNKHGAGKGKARQEDQQEEQEDPASSSPVTVTPRVNGNGSHAHTHTHQPQPSRPASPGRTTPVPNGVLGPQSIASAGAIKSYFDRVPAAGKASGDSASRTAVHGSSGRMSNGSASSINSSSSKRRSTNNPLQPRRYSSSSTAVRRGAGTAAKAAEDGVNGDERRPSTSASAGTVPEETDENGLPLQQIPGGWLNFTKFESGDMSTCIEFINNLIEASSASHNIPLAEFKGRHVKIMATGGGAHLYYDLLSEELGVEVRKEEEMQCLIAGLTFFMEIPHEVFWYSDQLVHDISHPHQPSQRTLASSTSSPAEADAAPPPSNDDLPRPSPNPPQYSLVFDENPQPQFPCMLVNIGSGVSIIKIDEYGQFERISGTSLGGGTLWGLLSMLTGADSFDEMLALSEQGDNANVDMLVGDIYGSDYSKIGLKSSTIASSFGKVFRKGKRGKSFKPEDIAKSLLYAISNNIGQIAYMNAEKHNLSHIYFGGCFIRGHAATISTLSYAIRFWSKGTKKALFLRHEGYLGAIGAWLRNIEEEDVRR